MRQPTITTVEEFNADQDQQFKDHLNKCRANGVIIHPEKEQEEFNRYFFKFGYKRGFVLWGKYPVYRKTKKALIYLIS